MMGNSPPTPNFGFSLDPDSPRQEVLAGLVLAGSAHLIRYQNGWPDEQRTTQAENLPNHAAWTFGHVALTLHRIAELLDENVDLPPEDFVTGDGSDGDENRYDTESVATGSEPADDPSRYPTVARSREIAEAAAQRLHDAIRNAAEDDLDAPDPRPGGDKEPLWSLVMRAVLHEAVHAGQLAALRKALGLASV